MVNTLQNFWLKHWRAILLGGLILLGAILLPHIVHAAPPPAPPPPSTPDNTSSDLLEGLSKVMKFLQRLIWPVIAMIGSLMQNDLLFGAGMEARLNVVWVNIRNIVNILFVLILLGIALYNVIAPPGQGNYHYKTILPKFVIALIAVNFTFIGIKVVLDGVNVISTAIFALPSNVECTLKGGTESATGCSVPDADTTTKKVGLFTTDEADDLCGAIYGGLNLKDDAQKAEYQTNVGNAGGQSLCGPDIDSTTGSYLTKSAAAYFNQLNAKNVAFVMAISLGRINLFDKAYLDPNQLNAKNLVLNVLFSIVLYIIYGTAFIALFVALLIRIVALWVMIAISPLMVLPMVLPESLKNMLGEGGDLQKKFVRNAIMPIPIGLVMSIGFVMLRGLQAAKFDAANPTVTGLMSNNNISLSLLTSGLTSLQELIIAVGTIIFIWVGVFEAFKGTAAEGITNSIRDTVKGFGTTLGKFAVGSIPLFPTGRMEKGKPVMANISDIGLALQAIPSKIRSEQTEHAKLALPGFMMTQDQAVQAIGGSKSWEEGMRNMSSVGRDKWKKPFQTQMDTWLKSDKDSKAKMDDIVKKINYPKGVAGFYQDLKDGNVKEEYFDKIYQEMGIRPGTGTEPIKPGEAGKEQQKKAEQRRFLDPKARKELRDKGLLTDLKDDKDQPLDTSDTALKGLQDTLASPKASAKEKEDAQKKLDAIDAALKKREQAAQNLDSSLKFVISHNTKGGTEVKGDKPDTGNAAAINDALEKQIADMSSGAAKDTPAYNAAKKKVMDAFAQQISKEQADSLAGAAATGSLLEEGIKAKQGAGAPPAKPVTGGGSPAPKPPAPKVPSGKSFDDPIPIKASDVSKTLYGGSVKPGEKFHGNDDKYYIAQ